MFTREINDLTLASDFATELFPNIRGGRYRNDCTFLATLRALLPDRMPDGEKLYVAFDATTFCKDDIKSVSAVGDLLNHTQLDGYTSKIVVHSLQNDNENNLGVLENVRTILEKSEKTKTLRGYKTLPVVSAFFKKALFNAEFIINNETKTAIVLVSNMSMKCMHFIQAVIPAILPWYFDGSEVNEEEKNLLQTLTKKTPADYCEAIEKFASRYDFRSARIKSLLNGFETIVEKKQLASVERDIENYNENMRSTIERYNEYARQREATMTRYLGLKQKIADGAESDIMDYFLCNTSLHIERVQDGILDFIVEGYLDEYDPEFFERSITNKDSVFYDYRGDKYSEDDVELLLKAIWGDEPRLKIKICAAYQMDLDRYCIRGLSHYQFPPAFDNVLANQHIQQHACLGNNEMYLQQCMAEHNYITAIEQCVASARNFNMTDSTVSEEFMKKIFSPRATRFIELPDGSQCTPLKALEWLKNGEIEEEAVKHE